MAANLSKGNSGILLAYSKGYRSTDYGEIISPDGNILRLGLGSNGYLLFRIKGRNVAYSIPAHRFSAYCYFGEELFENQCVRHLNGNKQDNCKSNLALGSLAENYNDNELSWRESFALKGAETRRKLNESQVREIKERIVNKDSLASIAECYGVARTTIQQIKEGKSYKWVI